MLALHAIWDSRADKLCLWAEASTLAPHKSRARRAAKPTVPAHPFAADSSRLLEAVADLSSSVITLSAEVITLQLHLPSHADGPQPSPESLLSAGSADDNKRAVDRLSAWDVAALSFDAGNALDLLLNLPVQPPQGMAYGSSLRFWVEAAKLVAEIVVGQRFAPTLRELRRETQQNEAPRYTASWEATLSDDADASRVRMLAEAMPPVCRALAHDDGVPTSGPLRQVRHFIHRTTDAFVRGAISNNTRRPSKAATAAERWLYALAADDPTFEAKRKDDRKILADIREWLGQLHAASDAAFRTCFRLEPPAERAEQGQSNRWQLTYHLQGSDDRSLLVPAHQVWRERGSTLTYLKRKFENPQERLLADLGKAARLFAPIEDSLRAAHPTALTLDTPHAYSFLRESAPLLEQSGFGVLLPPWWNKPAVKLGVKMRLKGKGMTGSNLLGMHTLVEYDWQIALGDQTLTRKEFEALARMKMPLVQVRGQWVELKPEMIEQAIAFFEKRQGGEMILGEALRVGLGQEQSETGMPVIDVQADGWVRDFLDGLSAGEKLPMVGAPTAFNGTLRPYQLRGVSWLAFLMKYGLGACLADDMGLGKTIVFLALALHLKRLGLLTKPALLVCPMSIVGNWQREAARFAPSLNLLVHHGAGRHAGNAFARAAHKHDLVITTYQLVPRDEKHLAEVEWGLVALDEAQNIKNTETKQTQAIRRLKAEHHVALTGTPVENRLSELWSIMDFLNRGYLGSASDFRSRFATPIERYRDAGQSQALKRLIQPFVLRRVKTDKRIIADLPDKLEMKVLCNLTREQATLYEAVVKDMLEKIEEAEESIQRKGLVLSALLRLKQVCNHPAHYLGDGSALPARSGKLSRLEEMLEEALAVGDKLLVFTQFAEMGAMLRGHLQERFGREVSFLHGGTPRKQRDAMVQRFQTERDTAPIFILSIKAGGVGLNLTAANHVFHFDRWWNPAVENQATDRAFRIGQTRNVQVHKFVCVGTVEEKIDQLIEDKKQLAESIVGTGENWLTELSTDQLREMFTLNRDAIGGE